jgi:hypothetical protein
VDDLVELLRGDHARICRLFAELAGLAEDPAALAGRWTELAEVLLAHVGAYEEIFQLPLRRMVPGSLPGTEDFDAGKLDIREAVAEARLQPTGPAQWWLAVRAAQVAADRHISSVEAARLPRFAQQVPASARRELGLQWKRYMAYRDDDRRDRVRLAGSALTGAGVLPCGCARTAGGGRRGAPGRAAGARTRPGAGGRRTGVRRCRPC